MKNKLFNLLSSIALFSSFFSLGMNHEIYRYINYKGPISKQQPTSDIERILAWKKTQYKDEIRQLLKPKSMELK